jgi:hypothetical protein
MIISRLSASAGNQPISREQVDSMCTAGIVARGDRGTLVGKSTNHEPLPDSHEVFTIDPHFEQVQGLKPYSFF